MINKKRFLLFLGISLVAFVILANLLLSFIEPRFYLKTTGRAIDTQKISIRDRQFEIQSPENITYNIRDKSRYLVYLNVSAEFNVKSWKYDLINARNGSVIYKNVLFTPRREIEVLRWENKLVIHATDESGNVFNETVEFFVASPDSFPIINGLNSTIYVCEGDTLRYNFTVNDPEGGENSGPIETRIEPFNIFHIQPEKKWMSDSQKSTDFVLFSEKLTKEHVGGIDNGLKAYDRTIYVNDGLYSSLNKTTIKVIEINNAPKIQRIGVKTEVMEWKGKNTLIYQAKVSDVEDGNQDSGNLKFSIDFGEKNLFEVSPNGVMKFTFDEGSFGIYNITLCVNDTGIESPYTDIKEICGQNGSSQTSCTNFSLTITKKNNPPTIIDFYPEKFELNGWSNSLLNFSVTAFDPEGTAPDVYWYIDEKEAAYSSGMDLVNGLSEIEHSFGCDSLGKHSIKARITDGLVNDTLEWKVTILPLNCKKNEETETREGWFCEEWSVCQNLKKSLEAKILPDSDFRTINDACTANKWGEENCGFQIRECADINALNSSLTRQKEMQRCYFTESPNCKDEIKNCHSRDCEFLVDCGGPCKPCPTCYDGIQNQGEEGVDCGGPCYILCEAKEKPTIAKNPLKYILIALVLILVLIIGLTIARISRLRKEIETEVE